FRWVLRSPTGDGVPTGSCGISTPSSSTTRHGSEAGRIVLPTCIHTECLVIRGRGLWIRTVPSSVRNENGRTSVPAAAHRRNAGQAEATRRCHSRGEPLAGEPSFNSAAAGNWRYWSHGGHSD